MKGIVITQFMEMVESRYGIGLADELLSADGLSTGGVYTAVGTYPHMDAVILMSAFGKARQQELGEVLMEYGEYLFTVFVEAYPVFFEGDNSMFEFLMSVEEVIHPQVLKLYPDAQLPRFESEMITDDQMRMVYLSDRRMGGFAHGLILGCANYFNESITVQVKDLSDGDKVEFIVTKR